jgi:hypothetical protein
MDAEAAPLAEEEQAEHLVEVGAGQQDPFHGAAAHRTFHPQGRE